MAVLPATDGQTGILANHVDTVIALEIGKLRIQLKDQTWRSALIGTGIM